MENRLNRKLILVWILIMLAGSALMFVGITHESLWYDESYSGALMNHTLGEIIDITGADSHPPLYYLMLKIFCSLFGTSVLTLRTFSALGAIALSALGIGPVRRTLGLQTGVIYSFLVFSLPITLSVSQDARMYTWAAFFVTASALFGYLAVTEQKKKDWIWFALFTLFSAYTHYYSLLAVIIIVALLFLFILITRQKLTPFLITCGIILAGYIPWLFKLSAQVQRVSGSFWIPRVTWDVIYKTLIYPFSNLFSNPWSIILTTISFIIAIGLIIWGITDQIIKKDNKGRIAIIAISGYALTILAGIIASYIIRPVLVERYMVPVLGLFILALAYGISRLNKRILSLIGCLLILILSVPQTIYTVSHRFKGPMTEATAYISPSIQPNDVFLHTDEHTFGTFSYYFPDNHHYYYQKPGTGGYSNYDAFLPNGTMVDSPTEIESGCTIWMLKRDNSTDTKSAVGFIGSKQVVVNGSFEDFSVDKSWYSFTIYPVTRPEE